MKERYKKAHMAAAFVYASLSHCNKRKVGCTIVLDDSILSYGFNGTPAGENNCCEDEYGNTKPNVSHAEANALNKIKQRYQSVAGASMFITKQPCIRCAEQIVKNKVSEVYYCETSRTNNNEGLEYLKKHEIYTEQIIKL
jgi:dCMP deaminase